MSRLNPLSLSRRFRLSGTLVKMIGRISRSKAEVSYHNRARCSRVSKHIAGLFNVVGRSV